MASRSGTYRLSCCPVAEELIFACRFSKVGPMNILRTFSLFAAMALAAPMAAAQAAPAGAKPTIVLVHGAWADGSSWNGVIKLLQADG